MKSLDTPGHPFGFEALYAHPKHRRLQKQGDVFTVTFEVDREVWDAFIAADQANSYAVVISKLDYSAPTEPETKPEEPEASGEYAYIAKEFFAHGWYASPNISKALSHLGAVPTDAKLAKIHLKQKMRPVLGLREEFSLKNIAPYDWQLWARESGCLNEINQMLRQAEARKDAQISRSTNHSGRS